MGVSSAVQNMLRSTPLYPAARALYRSIFRRDYIRDLEHRKAFYRPFVAPGSLCFDVGANHGNRTEVFLALGARVVAIEPAPACAASLKQWFGFNRRFTLEQAALGALPGRATLYVSDVDVISTMTPEWIEACRHTPHLAHAKFAPQEVEVTTLDRLIERHGVPDFIKIDVEGFEVEVLRGLSRVVPALSFEYTPYRSAPALECLRMLHALGDATYNVCAGESFALRFDRWLTHDQCVEFCTTQVPREPQFGDILVRFSAFGRDVP